MTKVTLESICPDCGQEMTVAVHRQDEQTIQFKYKCWNRNNHIPPGTRTLITEPRLRE
jgi:hypothetical protein